MTVNGKKLRTALRIADLTQEAAAEKLGVSRQTVSVWLKTEVLNAEIIQNVKSKLGIDLYDNVEASPVKNRPYAIDDHEDSRPSMLHSPETPYYSNTGHDVDRPGIPMYNFPASASVVEMYGDINDLKIVGYLNIPGAAKDSFALPVHGHSMYPTLESGSWCVLRPISDAGDIEWGHIYYVEYGDYRLFKRLLQSDQSDSVVLWSDNQSDVINGKPKYAPKTIKLERIKKLCLLTDIIRKPNY
ncbi:MAG: LexA family transcriptional regulator [Bacteroidetes bacterium]|nr:LexA family transcriptional regulator [Bacteroidota bacterium]